MLLKSLVISLTTLGLGLGLVAQSSPEAPMSNASNPDELTNDQKIEQQRQLFGQYAIIFGQINGHKEEIIKLKLQQLEISEQIAALGDVTFAEDHDDIESRPSLVAITLLEPPLYPHSTEARELLGRYRLMSDLVMNDILSSGKLTLDEVRDVHNALNALGMSPQSDVGTAKKLITAKEMLVEALDRSEHSALVQKVEALTMIEWVALLERAGNLAAVADLRDSRN